MGPPGDPDAVVDHAGRVHGMAGLRVVDASIMPSIPAANTNLPTMMVGAHTVMGSGLRESSGPAPDERNVGKSEPGDPG